MSTTEVSQSIAARGRDARPEQATSVVVGTAGHIDHGKTALVRALTGVDTDRLPEEKQRGITIDLGFASLELDGAGDFPLHVSLIDVPGHHAFVRNMLAGAGGIDCVLMVIAADEGVKAQTEEHLAICALLGIQRGVVALTKVDAVTDEQFASQRENVAAFLTGTFLENAPLVPVSAHSGAGLQRLKMALTQVAANTPQRSNEWVPRLPLDRSFSMRGFGTVVTGTLQSGTIRVGETLQQCASNRQLRVRGLQVHGQFRDRADAPCRVALNLAGVEVAEIGRGDVVSPPGLLAPTTVVDIELRMLRGAPVIKHGARVRVHAFTSDCLARVLLFDSRDTADSPSGLARLKLQEPMLLIPGDRMVLRQCSPAVTIGGGRVLDVSPPPRTRKAVSVEWLRQVQSADSAEAIRLRVARRDIEGVAIESMVAETGLFPEAIQVQIARLVQAGKVIACGSHASHYITAEALTRAVQQVETEAKAAGTVSRAVLRSKSGLNAMVFDLALRRILHSDGFELDGETVRTSGSGERLPERTQRLMQAIETAYAKGGLAAPLLADVIKSLGIAPQEMRQLITLLLRSKLLVRLGADDAFVHPGALQKLYADIRTHRGESFDVGRFKTFTGLTRKHAIPLLEHLDQVRVTRNNNGTRIVL